METLAETTVNPALSPEMERRRAVCEKKAPPGALHLTVISNDSQDARFHKRLRMFSDAGIEVRWLAYNRQRALGGVEEELAGMPGRVIANTHDRRYLQRLAAMALGLGRLLQGRFIQRNTDIIYCINLDNLFLAIVVAKLRHLNCKIVYEVADIQPVLLRKDGIGTALRALERWCLRRTSLLVYTSEAYLKNFLRPVQGYGGPSFLLENKIYPGLPGGDSVRPRVPGADGRLMVGFFGQLKCRRSLELIRRLADTLPERIHFLLRGYPNRLLRNDFELLIKNTGRVTYGGPYRYPTDLPELYNSIDLCWGFDFCSPGANSQWTLANRLYEAGYFQVPILVEQGTAGGDYVLTKGSGWAFPPDIEKSLEPFLRTVTAADLIEKREHIAKLKCSAFVLEEELAQIRTAFGTLAGPRGPA